MKVSHDGRDEPLAKIEYDTVDINSSENRSAGNSRYEASWATNSIKIWLSEYEVVGLRFMLNVASVDVAAL